MKREWFFLKDDSTLGPYNMPEIESFIAQNEIKADTLIQNMDESAWKPAYQFTELTNHFPDAALNLNLKNKKLAMPSIDSLNLTNEEIKEEKVEFTLKEYKLPPKFKKETRNFKKLYILFSGILTIFILIYFIFLKSQDVIEVDIEEIHKTHHNKIAEIINLPTEKLMLDLFLTKDKKSILIASNISNKLYYEVIFTPEAKTIPSNDSKIYKYNGVIENKFGKIVLNEIFLIGKYNIKFNIKKIPSWVSGARLESVDFFKKFDQDLNFEINKLLFDQTEDKYQDALKKYLKEELNKIQKPFLEKIARLETLLVTINQIWMALEDNLKYLKSSSDIQIFESIYKREAEVILQRLIIDAPQGDQQTNEVINQVFQFVQFTIDDVKKLKKVSNKKKEQLTLESLNKLKEIEALAKKRIDEIKPTIPDKLN